MVNDLYVACTPQDVAAFLQDETGFNAATTPSAGRIASYIAMAEGQFSERSHTTFGKAILVVEEIHDLMAERSRFPDFFDGFLTRRPIKLSKGPLVPFSAARNHRIEIYVGSGTPVAGSTGTETWEEWVSTKTYGRASDYWVDYARHILYLRKSFISRRDAFAKITYEYGNVPGTLTAGVTASATTIPVSDCKLYQNRGWVRIGDEYMFYTSKSAAAGPGNLTVPTNRRGYFDSTPEAHDSGDEVVQVPDHYRGLIIMRAATLFLQNARYIATIPEGSAEAYAIREAIRSWEKQWDDELAQTYGNWRNVG